MSVRHVIAIALMAAAPLAAARTQTATGESGGGCWSDMRIECAMTVARTGNGPDMHQWVRYVVLWHAPDYQEIKLDTAALRQALDRFRRETQIAADSGRVGFGGATMGYWRAAATRQRKDGVGAESLFVAGERYRIPDRDTVLVVLVDSVGSRTHEPQVEHAERIPTNAFRPFPYKRWIENCTVQHAGADELEPWVRELLGMSATIRAYLARAP